MFLKLIFVIALLYVYGAVAVTSIVSKGQRPELFELLDNEVGVFKITVSDEKFKDLMEEVQWSGVSSMNINMTDILKGDSESLKNLLQNIKNTNFKKVFPECDVAEIAPEFKINKKGNPSFDLDKILDGYDLDPEDYIDFDFLQKDYSKYIFRSNPDFNVYDILTRFGDCERDFSYSIDEGLGDLLEILGQLKEMEETSTDTVYYYNSYKKKYKIKDASLSVTLNGETQSFNNVTVSPGGISARYYAKPGFNLKIRGGQNLFGRSHFKIRPDFNEPTYLRSKISSDIHQSLGLKSINANYITLYINEQYMGLFILMDAYKPSWVEYEYKEKNTTSLFKCNTPSFITNKPAINCVNENKHATDEDDEELTKFVKLVDKAETAAELKEIFDVDHFITEMAIEYLLGAWDHILFLGHNFYLYRKPNGQWIYLSYDYDHEFGINLDRVFFTYITVDIPERWEKISSDYVNYSYSEFAKIHRHIIDVLILKDSSRFEQKIKEIVDKVFNPGTLFPHIDALKKFIKPYVELDKTKDSNGKYPGRVNVEGTDDHYGMEEWDANSEFTSVKTTQYWAYGIKYWILGKYRNVCQTYNLECDSTYMDPNYKYSINKDVEFKGYDIHTRKPNTKTTTINNNNTFKDRLTIKKNGQKGKGIVAAATAATTSTTTIKSKTTTTKKATKTGSINQCGEEYGRCAEGSCCSKYGWCGKGSEYCDVSKGCQSEFGQCNDNGRNIANKKTKTTTTTTKKTTTTTTKKRTTTTTKKRTTTTTTKKRTTTTTTKKRTTTTTTKKRTTTTTTKKRTTTTKKTSTKKTTTKSSSTSGKCGKNYGKCGNGECCSKYGFCGKSSNHCNRKKGCQSEFGKCW